MALIKRYVLFFFSLLIINILIVGATIANASSIGINDDLPTWRVEPIDNDGVLVSRNGQDIYPYFMIMETNKSIDKISFKLVQLHKNIVPEEQLQDDEVNRSIKPPKGGFIAEQVENALNKNPSLANIQEITNER